MVRNRIRYIRNLTNSILLLAAALALGSGSIDGAESPSAPLERVSSSEAVEQDEKQEKEIDRLITQFASGSFIERRVAMEKIFELSDKAQAALKSAAQSENREISRRSEYLLSLIEMGITPDTSAKRAGQLMRFYAGKTSVKQLILIELFDEQAIPELLGLLSLTDSNFQTNWIMENWSLNDALGKRIDFGSDRQRIEQIVFHPVIWRTRTSQSLYFALILDCVSEQFERLKTGKFASTSAPEMAKIDNEIAAKLALHLGGIKKAEPFLKEIEKSKRAKLLINHFVSRAKWREVLRVSDQVMDAEAGGEELTVLQKLLLLRWLEDDERYKKLITGIIDQTDASDKESVGLTVKLLVSSLNLDSAEKLFEHDEAGEVFQLLCYLNRYKQAFRFLQMGEDQKTRTEWFRTRAREVQKMNEELRRQYNRDTYIRSKRLYELLLNVAYYQGSLGQVDFSRQLFDILADIETDKDYRSQTRRTEMMGKILRLQDRDYCWTFVKQRYAETETRMAMSNLFSGDSTIAGFWLDALNEEIAEPFERLQTIAQIIRSPIAPISDDFDLERWMDLGLSRVYRENIVGRRVKLTYLADTLFKHGQDKRALELLWESVECGLPGSARKIAIYHFDHENWTDAQKWLELQYELADDEMVDYLAAMCYRQKGDQETYQFRRTRSLFNLAARYGDNVFFYQMNRLRQHEEIIQFSRQRLLASHHEKGSEYFDQKLVDSINEVAPEKIGVYPQTLMFKYAGRVKPSTNRLLYAEQARQSEMSRIRIALKQGETERAWKMTQTVANFNPGDSQLAEDFVPLFERAGRKDLADKLFDQIAEHYQSILKSYPNSALHHNNYAWICAKCDRRMDQSLKHAEAATRLKPNNSNYLDTLAEIHFLNGQKEQAIELIRQCIRLNPTKIHYRRQLKRFSE